jgi:predicted transposase YdaD
MKMRAPTLKQLVLETEAGASWFAEARAEGEARGEARGIARGRQQGEQNIINLLKCGKSPEEIIKEFK